MPKDHQQPQQAKRFRLCNKNQQKLNKYLAEIRRGIINVCELHSHDENTSMTKEAFEETYIDQLLGQTATAISLSIKAMTEALQAQAEAKIKAVMPDAETPAPAENKQEDN